MNRFAAEWAAGYILPLLQIVHKGRIAHGQRITYFMEHMLYSLSYLWWPIKFICAVESTHKSTSLRGFVGQFGISCVREGPSVRSLLW
jgi:hypothetical protein